MKFSYDHKADALYISLNDKVVLRSKTINPTFTLDLDEDNQVIGIEILHVRKSGIDPLTLVAEHHTSDMEVQPPDQEAIKAGHKARMEALKHRSQTEPQDL